MIRSGRYKLDECEYRVFVDGQDCTEILRNTVPEFSRMDEQMELLKNVLELRVEDGHIRRGEDGRITAYALMGGATLQNKEAMHLLGIDEISFTTSQKFLSVDPDDPTTFESSKNFAMSKGSSLPLLLGGMGLIDEDIQGDLFIVAAMHFDGAEIRGQYRSKSNMTRKVGATQTLRFEMNFSGSFDLRPAE